jgi:hypothetical protein
MPRNSRRTEYEYVQVFTSSCLSVCRTLQWAPSSKVLHTKDDPTKSSAAEAVMHHAGTHGLRSAAGKTQLRYHSRPPDSRVILRKGSYL